MLRVVARTFRKKLLHSREIKTVKYPGVALSRKVNREPASEDRWDSFDSAPAVGNIMSHSLPVLESSAKLRTMLLSYHGGADIGRECNNMLLALIKWNQYEEAKVLLEQVLTKKVYVEVSVLSAYMMLAKQEKDYAVADDISNYILSLSPTPPSTVWVQKINTLLSEKKIDETLAMLLELNQQSVRLPVGTYIHVLDHLTRRKSQRPLEAYNLWVFMIANNMKLTQLAFSYIIRLSGSLGRVDDALQFYELSKDVVPAGQQMNDSCLLSMLSVLTAPPALPNAATHVHSVYYLMEDATRHSIRPTQIMYYHLIKAFSAIGDVVNAEFYFFELLAKIESDNAAAVRKAGKAENVNINSASSGFAAVTSADATEMMADVGSCSAVDDTTHSIDHALELMEHGIVVPPEDPVVQVVGETYSHNKDLAPLPLTLRFLLAAYRQSVDHLVNGTVPPGSTPMVASNSNYSNSSGAAVAKKAAKGPKALPEQRPYSEEESMFREKRSKWEKIKARMVRSGDVTSASTSAAAAMFNNPFTTVVRADHYNNSDILNDAAAFRAFERIDHSATYMRPPVVLSVDQCIARAKQILDSLPRFNVTSVGDVQNCEEEYLMILTTALKTKEAAAQFRSMHANNKHNPYFRQLKAENYIAVMCMHNECGEYKAAAEVHRLALAANIDVSPDVRSYLLPGRKLGGSKSRSSPTATATAGAAMTTTTSMRAAAGSARPQVRSSTAKTAAKPTTADAIAAKVVDKASVAAVASFPSPVVVEEQKYSFKLTTTTTTTPTSPATTATTTGTGTTSVASPPPLSLVGVDHLLSDQESKIRAADEARNRRLAAESLKIKEEMAAEAQRDRMKLSESLSAVASRLTGAVPVYQPEEHVTVLVSVPDPVDDAVTVTKRQERLERQEARQRDSARSAQSTKQSAASSLPVKTVSNDFVSETRRRIIQEKAEHDAAVRKARQEAAEKARGQTLEGGMVSEDGSFSVAKHTPEMAAPVITPLSGATGSDKQQQKSGNDEKNRIAARKQQQALSRKHVIGSVGQVMPEQQQRQSAVAGEGGAGSQAEAAAVNIWDD